MSEPSPYVFFCNEVDFPRFQALCPGEFPATYESFVTAVDRHVEKMMEQITLIKTEVSIVEFKAFLTRTGLEPNKAALAHCAFIIGGNRK